MVRLKLNSSIDIPNMDTYYDTDLVGVAKRRNIYASEVQDALVELDKSGLGVLNIKMTDAAESIDAGTDVMFVTDGGNMIWYPDGDFELVETLDDKSRWDVAKDMIKSFAKKLSNEYSVKILPIWELGDEESGVLNIIYDELGSLEGSKIFPKHTKEVEEQLYQFAEELTNYLKPLRSEVPYVSIELGPIADSWEV